ncbi:MAG: ComF family protein [Chitinophagales bacterium]
MVSLQEIGRSFSHLFFPGQCLGCGSDLTGHNQMICLHCLNELPPTDFQFYPNNPVEKIFWGRSRIIAASCHYYFDKDSVLQHLLHQFKYKGKKQLGIYFGRILGKALKDSGRFKNLDALVPIPLFASREKKRGYNQAALLCDGMAEVMDLPVLPYVLKRKTASETQTAKDRISRWQNMKGRFQISDPALLENKHVLLVDDVITTGSTLDACANELLRAEGIRISIAALAYTII